LVLSFVGPQTPSCGTPPSPFDCWSAAAQATQSALHAPLQQTPSTQKPLAHARQGGALQSPLAPRLHIAPCTLLGWQAPFDAQ